jgi:hypothetical protein
MTPGDGTSGGKRAASRKKAAPKRAKKAAAPKRAKKAAAPKRAKKAAR